MKHNRYVVTALALACVIPLFLGCPTEDDDPNYGGDLKDLPAVSLGTGDPIKYFSLSTGLEVTGDAINGNTWDIAFSRTRLVLTNSGATAEGLSSGGQGGVWYTDKTELSEVASDDRLGEDDPILKNYLTDKAVYIKSGHDSNNPTSTTTLNIMSYVGYESETTENAGSAADNALYGYEYNKKQYMWTDGVMPPVFSTTGQVYTIRHGDGEHYSKIQIEYEFVNSKDNWLVSYQNF
jgi:hypothetical protein